jgi:lysozyme
VTSTVSVSSVLPLPIPKGHRHVNKAGIDLIKKWEGLSLKAYKDMVGVWTVGYGHTGRDVLPGQVITLEEAESLLISDLYFFEAKVMEEVHVPLNDNQFAALVSWTYNLGADWLDEGGKVQASFIINLNKGDYAGVPAGLKLFDNAGNQKDVPGLIARRADEAALWNR